MSFHDVRLPEKFSTGSVFGPGLKTQLTQLKSGASTAIQPWPNAARRFNLERGVTSMENLIELRNFFLARDGMANTFRIYDPTDNATNPTGIIMRQSVGLDAAITELDEILVPVSDTQYQFVKRYVSGPTTKLRQLTMLVAGTQKVSIADVLQTTGFTYDLIGGKVNFSSPPGDVVKGGTQFDVHARFGPSADEFFQTGIKAFNAGSLPTIEAIEELAQAAYNQACDRGGSHDWGDITADVVLNTADAKLNIFRPTTSGKNVFLPLATSLPDGIDWFVFLNEGSQSIQVKTSGGTNVGAAITAGSGPKILYLATVSGTKTWYLS